MFVRYLLYCRFYQKKVSLKGYNLFRSSFLWRFLVANDLDTWISIDRHMDMDQSELKAVEKSLPNVVTKTRLENVNGDTMSKYYKWAHNDHVPRSLEVSGMYKTKINIENVTKLYNRAKKFLPSCENFPLADVLEGFSLHDVDGA